MPAAGRRRWLLALVVALAGCGPTPSPTPQDQDPPAATVAPSLGAGDVAEHRRFRESFGLRSDEAWIVAVAADPASADGARKYGIPLTPEEVRDLDRRSRTTEAIKNLVIPYGSAHPDEWAGAWIDQQAGGRFVVQFSGRIDEHRNALYSQISPDANFEVRAVKFSLAELHDLEAQLAAPANAAWFATIPAYLKGYGPSVSKNRLHIDISSANPNATSLIEEHFGWQGAIEVESDGNGALVLPLGRLRVRATDATGRPIPGLTCLALPDLAEAYDPPIDVPTTDARGQCELELPATGYWLRLERDQVFVGLGRVVVMPRATSTLEISLDIP